MDTVVDSDAARVCGKPLGEVAQPRGGFVRLIADPAVPAGASLVFHGRVAAAASSGRARSAVESARDSNP